MTFVEQYVRVERCTRCQRMRVPLGRYRGGSGPRLFFTSDGKVDWMPGRFCGATRASHEYELVRRVPTPQFIAAIEAALGFSGDLTPLDPIDDDLEGLRAAIRDKDDRISRLRNACRAQRARADHEAEWRQVAARGGW